MHVGYLIYSSEGFGIKEHTSLRKPCSDQTGPCAMVMRNYTKGKGRKRNDKTGYAMSALLDHAFWKGPSYCWARILVHTFPGF